MFLHLATNMNNLEDAITKFKKETNINIEGLTRVDYDITDLETLQDKSICSELKQTLLNGLKSNKFVIVRFDSLDRIPSAELVELYDIIKHNTYVIEV